jgi:hypothetical protein
MKTLISELAVGKKSLYRVFIKGISNNLSNQFYYTHAESEDKAIASIVSKILKHVQSPGSTMKNWVYQDGNMKIRMNPGNRGLLTAYLLNNPRLVDIQRMIGNAKPV